MPDERIRKLNNFVKHPNITVFSEIEQIGSKLGGIKDGIDKIANKPDVKIPEVKIPEQKEVKFPEVQKVKGSVSVENLKDIKLDTSKVIEAIKGIKFEEKEQTDYTLILDDISTALEKENPNIPKIIELLQKLPTVDDMERIFEGLEKMSKMGLEFDKYGRLKVSVDKGGMVTTDHATRDKQDDIITAVEAISFDTTGLATETKQDDIITELQDLSVEVDNVGSALVSGRKTVTTAGTAEVLKADTTLTQGIIIMALKTNTNNIFVGDSNVDKTSDKQTELEPGESIAIAVNNTNLIYIDVTTNGEGVSFIGS